MYVSIEELAKRFNSTPDHIEKLALKESWPFKLEHTTAGEIVLFDYNSITTTKTKSSEDFFVLQSAEYHSTDEEVFNKYRDKQKKRIETKGPGITRVAFNKTLPVGIAFIGDQHVGTNCWFDRMVVDGEIIANTDGMFAVSGGDGLDNYIKHWSAMVSKTSRPTDELRAFRHYLKIFAHKILLIISGNHDAWSEDFAGVNLIRGIADELNIQYSPNWRGILKVHFQKDLLTDQNGQFSFIDEENDPNRPYGILVQHKGRYNSDMNPGHTCHRTFDWSGAPGIDIVAIGHNHRGWFGPFERQGRTIWGIRWASYKVRDEFAIRHGYPQSNVAIAPAVVLFPDERKIVPFEDVSDAAFYLKGVRAEYAKKEA